MSSEELQKAGESPKRSRRAGGRTGGRAAGFEIEILGKRQKARINIEPLFDPMGEKMRSLC